jgi:hypothetical protein
MGLNSHNSKCIKETISFTYSNCFPGSQPVSMGINNIKLLGEKPYRVSWKADGTRQVDFSSAFFMRSV